MNPRLQALLARLSAVRLAAGATALFVCGAAALISTGAAAQAPPVLVIDDASVFEGNSGTRILSLPVRFVGAQSGTVSGMVSATPLTGTSFNPATGGAACGAAGVDFEQFANVPFSIPPNTPNGTLSVNIRICGDTVIEPSEHIFVFFSNVVGAQCLEGNCNAVATIRNDDGPPTLSINNISVSESAFGSRTANFTVTSSHPAGPGVAVTFATRNGTATAQCKLCSPPVPSGDYVGKSGSLPISLDALSATIGVTILSDNLIESDENFFVDLSAPTNATLGSTTGRATIHDGTLSVGGYQLSPDDAQVQADERIVYTLDWTVPDNEVWRNLKTIDLRLRDHQTALWLRWDEASNRFSLCRRVDGDEDEGDKADAQAAARAADRRPVLCGAGALPGSASVLETPFARLHLADSTVAGSGPTGQRVTLQLALSLKTAAAGHDWRVELAAADDFGNQDAFVQASSLAVSKPTTK